MADKILVHNINRPAKDVYPYFSNIEQFISIHPVIYKCDTLSENCYLLYERLKFAGLSISFSYEVVIARAVPYEQVIMCSEIRKGMNLKLVFDIAERDGNTVITEAVTFDGPFFIKPIFIPFLAKMHVGMIANLNNLRV